MAATGEERLLHIGVAAFPRPGKFVLFVGDPDEGPPVSVRRGVSSGGGLSRTSKTFPAAALVLSTQAGEVPVLIRYASEPPPLDDLTSDADVVVVPLHVPEPGDLRVAEPAFVPASKQPPLAHPYEATQPGIEALPAGAYEILARADGRNELRERIDVTVYPCTKPTQRVVQVGSEFAKVMVSDPKSRRIADDAVGVPSVNHWDVYLTGELPQMPLPSADPTLVPRWFRAPSVMGIPRHIDAWATGNSVAGSNPAFEEFVVCHLASHHGEVAFRVTVLDGAPGTATGPTDDSTTRAFYSESGQVSIFDGNVHLVGSFDLGEPGKYGLKITAHNRDAVFAVHSERHLVSPESWDLEFWPVSVRGSVDYDSHLWGDFPVVHETYVAKSAFANVKNKGIQDHRMRWERDGYEPY